MPRQNADNTEIHAAFYKPSYEGMPGIMELEINADLLPGPLEYLVQSAIRNGLALLIRVLCGKDIAVRRLNGGAMLHNIVVKFRQQFSGDINISIPSLEFYMMKHTNLA